MALFTDCHDATAAWIARQLTDVGSTAPVVVVEADSGTTGNTTQITSAWFDELQDVGSITASTLDLADFKLAAERSEIRRMRREQSRVHAPAPRAIVRRPQVMHGRHQLAPLARSSC